MQKLTPCLWFDKADQAIEFYKSIFKDLKVHDIKYFGKDMPRPEGEILYIMFEIMGQQIMFLNGGPEYKLSSAFSLLVNCKDQEEVDYYWDKLVEGGKEIQCGWLEDKYGISWQIVPENMNEYLFGDDKEGSMRAMQCMMKMIKLNIAEIKDAYLGIH